MPRALVGLDGGCAANRACVAKLASTETQSAAAGDALVLWESTARGAIMGPVAMGAWFVERSGCLLLNGA